MSDQQPVLHYLPYFGVSEPYFNGETQYVQVPPGYRLVHLDKEELLLTDLVLNHQSGAQKTLTAAGFEYWQLIVKLYTTGYFAFAKLSDFSAGLDRPKMYRDLVLRRVWWMT